MMNLKTLSRSFFVSFFRNLETVTLMHNALVSCIIALLCVGGINAQTTILTTDSFPCLNQSVVFSLSTNEQAEWLVFKKKNMPGHTGPLIASSSNSTNLFSTSFSEFGAFTVSAIPVSNPAETLSVEIATGPSFTNTSLTIESSIQEICNETQMTLSTQSLPEVTVGTSYIWSVNDSVLPTLGGEAATDTLVTYQIKDPNKDLHITLRVYEDTYCNPAQATNVIVSAQKTILSNTLNLNASSTAATCGLTDGSASVVANGGVPPYTYLWSNGAQSASVNDVKSGLYTVSVSDANGCERFATVGLKDQIGGPEITAITPVNPTCHGLSNGSISIDILPNGTSPLSIFWSNGERDINSINNLKAGDYYVRVINQNGCGDYRKITLSAPAPIALNNALSVEPTACGQNTGSITIEPSQITGGTPSYSFTYGNFSGPSTSNLPAGAYTLLTTDNNGCTHESYFSINETTPEDVLSHSVGYGSADCNFAQSPVWGSIYSYALHANGATLDSVYFNNTKISDGAFYGRRYIKRPASNQLTTITYYSRLANGQSCRTFERVKVKKGKNSSMLEELSEIDLCVASVYQDNIHELQFTTDPSADAEVTSYNIYREDYNAGQFTLIDNIATSEGQSVNHKEDFSDAANKSHKYLISAVNACGQESFWSKVHKTVHLSHVLESNGDITLSWTPYKGYILDSARLMLDTTGTGSDSLFFLHQTFAPSQTSYTISQLEISSTPWLQTAVTSQSLDFLIEYSRQDSCTTFLKSNSNNNNGRSNKDMCCEDESIPWAGFVNTSPSTQVNCNGSIALEVYGGNAPYTYQWSNGSNGSGDSNLCPGDYFITITDATGDFIIAYGYIDNLVSGFVPVTNTPLQAYPNPTTGPLLFWGDEKPEHIRLFTLQGQMVFNTSYKGPIYLPNSLARSVYVLKAHFKEGKEKVMRLILNE